MNNGDNSDVEKFFNFDKDKDITPDELNKALGEGLMTEGDMAMYENYAPLQVSATEEKLRKKAEAYVQSLSKLYLATQDIMDGEYVKAFLEIETDSLTSLLKQVKYSEHVLDTLMTQLDNGGYMNGDIYSRIREQQKLAMSITLEVSKYRMTLPNIFKAMEEDVRALSGMDATVVGHHNNINGQPALGEGKSSDGDGNTIDDLRKPQLGTRDVLQQIRRMNQDAEKLKDAELEVIDNRGKGHDEVLKAEIVQHNVEVESLYAEGDDETDN